MSSTLHIGPLDSRYSDVVAPLTPFLSDYARARYRLAVEVAYLITLSREKNVPLRAFTKKECAWLLDLVRTFSPKDAERIGDIEKKGTNGRPATKHDVKAIEYWLRDAMRTTSLKDVESWAHWGLTSEDVNSCAFALMTHDAVSRVLLPVCIQVCEQVEEKAQKYARLPMLARTHGQSATPTTFGKEMRVFSERIRACIDALQKTRYTCKCSGATGSWNAQVVALPQVEWLRVSRTMLRELNVVLPPPQVAKKSPKKTDCTRRLRLLTATTQIDPHDAFVELSQTLHRTLAITTDCAQDFWRYISDGWVAQRVEEGAVGSSVMPHKVNPIQFELAEGNAVIAQSYFEMYARKLPISRLQRDLSDSTVLRTVGTAFGHMLVSLTALTRGVASCDPDPRVIQSALSSSYEVITEAVQTMLRMYGDTTAYESLKKMSRGTHLSREDLHAFIRSSRLPKKEQEKLCTLTPETYIGVAPQIARGSIT